MKKLGALVAAITLAAAGAATAAVLVGHVTLKPGRCTVIAKTRVCAARASTVTVTATVTTTPTPMAPLSFSGNGDETLPPFALTQPATLYWTNSSSVLYIQGPNGLDTGSEAGSGQTWIPAGTYTGVSVISGGGWAIQIHN